jgi:hypothetical protein
MDKHNFEDLHSLTGFGITEQSIWKDGIRIDNEWQIPAK